MRKRLTRFRVIVPLLVFAWFAPTEVSATNLLVNGSFSANGGGWNGATGGASCASGFPSMGLWSSNSLTFTYVNRTVTQTVTVPQPSTLLLTFDAINRPENYINSRFTATLTDSDQIVSSGQQIPPKTSTEYNLVITTTQPNENVIVAFSGDDNGLYWAGCYGVTLRNVLLTASPSSADNLVWLELDEGWQGDLTAPSGVFTSVLFASYGTPNGSNGDYSIGECHAEESQSIIEDAVIGVSSVTLSSSNDVFGDPCGGTYKRLYVLASYSPVPTTTTSTTTTSTTTTSTTTTSTTTTSTTTTSTTTTTTIPVTTTTELTTTTEPTTTTENPTTTAETTTTTVLETTTSAPATTQPQTTVLKPAAIPENATTTSTVAVTTTVPVTTTSTVPQTTIPEIPETTIPEISEEMTVQEVVAIASNPEVLESLSTDELEQVFANLDVSELSDEQVEQLVETLSVATDEVKEAFEEKINIFDDEEFGEYVPQGSVVTVNQRRVIIVGSVVLSSIGAAMTPPSSGGGTAGPSGQGGSGGGGRRRSGG